MRSYNLNIAGYNIGFESEAGGPDFAPGDRFLRNITEIKNSDILIMVHAGKLVMDEKAERVFHAPYVEEINGILIQNRADFWSVWKHRSDLFISTVFPNSLTDKKATLRFSLTSKQWDLWIEGAEGAIDPFEYPLDGLILYYLTVIYGDILIHASGILHNGKGYLFSGISGKGKSTIAMLWENACARVIHDDRLIIRNTGSGYRMYNTPVYNNDDPREAPLNKIFIIEHGLKNSIIPVNGAAAVTLIMANCIQHHWGHDIIVRLLGSVSIMSGAVPTAQLIFKPDRHVIDHILEHE
jgi:hypothetical protein